MASGTGSSKCQARSPRTHALVKSQSAAGHSQGPAAPNAVAAWRANISARPSCPMPTGRKWASNFAAQSPGWAYQTGNAGRTAAEKCGVLLAPPNAEYLSRWRASLSVPIRFRPAAVASLTTSKLPKDIQRTCCGGTITGASMQTGLVLAPAITPTAVGQQPPHRLATGEFPTLHRLDLTPPSGRRVLLKTSAVTGFFVADQHQLAAPGVQQRQRHHHQ